MVNNMDKQEKEQIKQQVLDYIRNHPEGVSDDELDSVFKLDQVDMAIILHELEDEGKLRAV